MVAVVRVRDSRSRTVDFLWANKCNDVICSFVGLWLKGLTGWIRVMLLRACSDGVKSLFRVTVQRRVDWMDGSKWTLD